MMISVGGASRGLVGVIHHQVLVRLLPVARLRVALQLLVIGAARALLPLTLALELMLGLVLPVEGDDKAVAR